MKNKSILYQFLKLPIKVAHFFIFLNLNISPVLNASSPFTQCVANVYIEYDNTLSCQRTVYLINVLANTNTSAGGIDTTGMRIAINDLTPGNGNIVDGISPSSGWNYGVFKADNSLFCAGNMYSLDNLAPQLVTNSFNILDTIDYWCNDFNFIYNIYGSWNIPSSPYYTGKPSFIEGCGGPVQLKVTDVILNEDCNSIFKILRRNFQAIDARGNDVSISQIIRFKYPELNLFLPPSNRDTLNFNVCTSAQIQGGIDSVIRANYSAVNPKTGLSLSLFDLDNQPCKYSAVATKISNNQCPIGLNMRVVVNITDGCTGTILKDSILINFLDNRIPFGL
jgi:hypothetical protein